MGTTTNDREVPTPVSSIAVTPPIGWEVIKDLTAEVRLTMLQPETEMVSEFRTNLVLATAPANLPLDDWMRINDEYAADSLDGYRLLDLERVDIAGIAGLRQLAHYHLGGVGLTLEQWSFIDRGDGWTLSGTAPDAAYPLHAPVFAHVATSLGPPADTDRGEAPR